jgi:hypothetical protein
LILSLASMERTFSVGYSELRDFEKARYHCEQTMYYSRKVKENDMKTKTIINAFNCSRDVNLTIEKNAVAKAVMEEAYNYVAELYNPEHPQVLFVAGKLIESLNQTGNCYDAERFL